MLKEMDLDNFDPPLADQQIVRICNSRGNNLHEVESADENVDEHFLVSMPTKFRRNVWVKRGDFVLVEAIEEGDKVKAEIVRILTPQHIREFTKDGIWPKKFLTHATSDRRNGNGRNSDRDESDGSDLERNTNRNRQKCNTSDSETDDSQSDSDDGEEAA